MEDIISASKKAYNLALFNGVRVSLILSLALLLILRVRSVFGNLNIIYTLLTISVLLLMLISAYLTSIILISHRIIQDFYRQSDNPTELVNKITAHVDCTYKSKATKSKILHIVNKTVGAKRIEINT